MILHCSKKSLHSFHAKIQKWGFYFIWNSTVLCSKWHQHNVYLQYLHNLKFKVVKLSQAKMLRKAIQSYSHTSKSCYYLLSFAYYTTCCHSVLFSDPLFVHDLDHYPPLDHRHHSALHHGLFPTLTMNRFSPWSTTSTTTTITLLTTMQSVMLLPPQTSMQMQPYLRHVPS